MIINEEELRRLLSRCEKTIECGLEDSFRPYEEGVKDTINWILNGGECPDIGLDDEGENWWEEENELDSK